MPLTILEGSTFCICDEIGDVKGPSLGFFADDTRFLSRCILTINGARPLLLSGGKAEYYSAGFFLRNPVAGELSQDEVSIARERFVGDGMQDRLLVQNHADRTVELELALELGTDFADIFAVKAHDFTLGDPMHAPPLPPLVAPRYDEGHNQLIFADGTGFAGRTQVVLSERGEVDGATVRYHLRLEPRERWHIRVDMVPATEGIEISPARSEREFGEERARVRDSLSAWELQVPQLRSDWADLHSSFRQSVYDIASLRIRTDEGSLDKLLAAGMPWFMTVFGRDTVITAMQTMLFGPELARSSLTVLAELQATGDDPHTDAEPGKIVHEVRKGKGALAWFPRYYGTLDATPLYLVLLSEVWRWTDDVGLLGTLKAPAMRALEWIDGHGDRDGDGFVEYGKRSERGLDNQSWKDSWNSQLHHDGTAARSPIAPVEVQGYVYDAKRRLAEIARTAWRDRELADRLDRDADELYRRFNEAFWSEERGGYYVLGLDADKRHIDSLCSNMGHLLWSGIVPPERVDAVVDRLMGDALWSGWGVRTMSTDDGGFNPLTYHNGTVWPHDNSLIAWGLARYERWPEAQRIMRRTFEAAGHFGHQLPEVFAGFARSDTPFPIAYPTATRPQAWAAGTPVLLLRLLLGLEPNPERGTLRDTRARGTPFLGRNA